VEFDHPYDGKINITRMDEIGARVARDRTNAARERTSTDEAECLPN
jgi:hypothetical protein